MKTIKRECLILSELIATDNSDLTTSWNSVSANMDNPIHNFEDVYVSIKKMLNAY